MEEIIKLNGLTKDYGEGRGIFGFDYYVKKGEVFGLVGTNGSGKTTTLRHLMGFLKPDKGSCTIMGMDCYKQARDIKKYVGYIPGEINFPDVGSGNSFLRLQADFLGIDDMRYTNELIERFKIDTSAPLRRMSKGMKQKTAIVAAFMAKPDILLLDEPSTGLDPLMRDTLIELIREQKKAGKTVFMSSHVFKELEDCCDTVAFIDKGKPVDIVNRKQYDADMPKHYRIGFVNGEEMETFAKTSGFMVLAKNEKYRHMDLVCAKEKINELFAKLQKFDIRYINYVPYSLEWYYTEIINKGVEFDVQQITF